MFVSVESNYATKQSVGIAVDGLGEEIASDINDMETSLKVE